MCAESERSRVVLEESRQQVGFELYMAQHSLLDQLDADHVLTPYHIYHS